jgi:hypothetical protein
MSDELQKRGKKMWEEWEVWHVERKEILHRMMHPSALARRDSRSGDLQLPFEETRCDEMIVSTM